MTTPIRAGSPSSVLIDAVLTGALSIVAVFAIVFAVLGARGTQGPPLPQQAVSLDRAEIVGMASAPVVLLAFSDFQCPFCGHFASTVLPALHRDYIRKGKVLFAFRHYPLATHRRSEEMAIAASCAGMQGGFWRTHDFLFARSPEMPSHEEIANAAGLDLLSFRECLPRAGTSRVREDAEIGSALGIRATPTFFLGRLTAPNQISVSARLEGDRDLETFVE